MNEHDIAIQLEYKLRDKFNISYRPRGTIFDADYIEMYMFFDDMKLLLALFSKKDYTEFIDKYYQYKGINMRDIPNYKKIYDEFNDLME